MTSISKIKEIKHVSPDKITPIEEIKEINNKILFNAEDGEFLKVPGPKEQTSTSKYDELLKFNDGHNVYVTKNTSKFQDMMKDLTKRKRFIRIVSQNMHCRARVCPPIFYKGCGANMCFKDNQEERAIEFAKLINEGDSGQVRAHIIAIQELQDKGASTKFIKTLDSSVYGHVLGGGISFGILRSGLCTVYKKDKLQLINHTLMHFPRTLASGANALPVGSSSSFKGILYTRFEITGSRDNKYISYFNMHPSPYVHMDKVIDLRSESDMNIKMTHVYQLILAAQFINETMSKINEGGKNTDYIFVGGDLNLNKWLQNGVIDDIKLIETILRKAYNDEYLRYVSKKEIEDAAAAKAAEKAAAKAAAKAKKDAAKKASAKADSKTYTGIALTRSRRTTAPKVAIIENEEGKEGEASKRARAEAAVDEAIKKYAHKRATIETLMESEDDYYDRYDDVVKDDYYDRYDDVVKDEIDKLQRIKKLVIENKSLFARSDGIVDICFRDDIPVVAASCDATMPCCGSEYLTSLEVLQAIPPVQLRALPEKDTDSLAPHGGKYTWDAMFNSVMFSPHWGANAFQLLDHIFYIRSGLIPTYAHTMVRRYILNNPVEVTEGPLLESCHSGETPLKEFKENLLGRKYYKKDKTSYYYDVADHYALECCLILEDNVGQFDEFTKIINKMDFPKLIGEGTYRRHTTTSTTYITTPAIWADTYYINDNTLVNNTRPEFFPRRWFSNLPTMDDWRKFADKNTKKYEWINYLPKVEDTPKIHEYARKLFNRMIEMETRNRLKFSSSGKTINYKMLSTTCKTDIRACGFEDKNIEDFKGDASRHVMYNAVTTGRVNTIANAKISAGINRVHKPEGIWTSEKPATLYKGNTTNDITNAAYAAAVAANGYNLPHIGGGKQNKTVKKGRKNKTRKYKTLKNKTRKYKTRKNGT